MTPTEKHIATRLVDAILEAGYTVSVFDGEEYSVKRSTDRQTIIEALGATESDVLTVRYRNPPNVLARPVGQIALFYGNGDDLIADHTDNHIINTLVAATERVSA